MQDYGCPADPWPEGNVEFGGVPFCIPEGGNNCWEATWALPVSGDTECGIRGPTTMIRKAIIVVLTLGVVGTAVVCVTSGRSARLLFGNNAGSIAAEQGSLVITYGGAFVEKTIPLRTYPRTYTIGRHRIVIVRLWIVFILFATYPTIAFIRGPVRRHRRRRKGLCIRCGYNLTGNVSGVCPECGEPT